MARTTWSLLILVSFLSFVLFFSIQVERAEAGSGGGLLLGCCSTVPGNAVLTPGSCVGCPEGIPCARDQSLCLEEGFFLAGGACEEEGPQFRCSDPGDAAGCCVQFSEGTCSGGLSLIECQNSNGSEWLSGISCQEVENCENGPVGPTNVPTLNHLGLIAMAGVLGIVSFMIMRRKKVSA